MSTLVVSSFTPALGSGRGVRTYGLVRALAALGPVEVLHAVFGGEQPSAEFAAIDGVRYHGVRPSRGPRRALAVLRARRAGAPAPLARGVSAELAAAAARMAPGFDRVVAEDPTAAVTLAGLARRRPVVYSGQNLEWPFRTDWGPQERVQAFERGVLERSAETWLPSRRDVEGARELAPTASVRLVPNVVDVAAVEPRRESSVRGPALMLADFTYDPNREGLEFLLAEVMPRVWEREPGARLTVAGRGLAARPGDERVTYLGFVDDLHQLYATAGCAVVPLLRGGGSPLKFVEALAHGLPVVATPPAAAGLEARPGEHYLEGAGAEGLAEALLTAAAGGGEAIGAAGRALAEREYSIEALARRLAA